MSFDSASVAVSLVVGSAGFVAFAYGKRQRRFPQLVTGVALMAFPYFVPSPLATALIAAALLGLMALAVRLGW